jgi:hypothetical protein
MRNSKMTRFAVFRFGLVAMFGALFAPSAMATLMITGNASGTPAGFTAITPPDNAPLSAYSVGAGSINFIDGAGDALDPTYGSGWWDFSAEMPIFTTGLPSNSSHIEITFTNLDVFGFAFNIGANKPATAWFTVDFESSNGTSGQLSKHNIAVGPGNSPGFNVSNDGAGNCERITKIVVDPAFTWGIGNMSVDTDRASCEPVSVPEPGSLSLLALSLGLLGLMRKVRKA